MTVDERARHALFRRLEEVLGSEDATTLMAHLPPAGWSEVATAGDLGRMQERIDQRFEQVDQRFEQVDQRFEQMEARFDLKLEALEHRILGTLHRELTTQTRLYLATTSGALATIAALAFAAARLT